MGRRRRRGRADHSLIFHPGPGETLPGPDFFIRTDKGQGTMPTLNLNRFRQSNGSRNIVIGDTEYTGRPFSVMQFITYAEKFEAGGLSEAEELRMNVDAIVARLSNSRTGAPIDRTLVEDMSAEELRMVVDFLSTAKAREKLPEALRDQVNETWDRMGPYLDKGFDGDPSPTTERSTSGFASTGSSESTEPLASPTAQ
jgi:hypothetical protein